jgi:hypothetical protein
MSITSYGSYAYLLQEFSKTTLKQEQIISKLESLEKESAKLLARKQESLERRNKYIVVVKEKNFEQKYIFSTGNTHCRKC